MGLHAFVPVTPPDGVLVEDYNPYLVTAYDGSYGGFGMWRCDIARCLGWTVVHGGYRFPDPLYRVHDLHAAAFRCDYGEHHDLVMADPINVLMLHADNDGTIPWQFCWGIGMRLIDLLLARDGLHDDWHRQTTQRFVNGCLAADMHQTDMEFR